MKTKTKDELMQRIKAFVPPPLPKTIPNRLHTAIERVRWHICGVFGVHQTAVTDAHIAAFLRHVKVDYLFPNLPGIGCQTEEAMLKWARKQS
jgi:hypothetical protein